MATEDLSRREQQAEDTQPDDAGGNEPDVEVQQGKDGNTEVVVSGLSRRERRAEERRKEIASAVSEHTKPLLDQLAGLQRSLAEMSFARAQPPAPQPPAPTGRNIDPEVKRIRQRQTEIHMLVNKGAVTDQKQLDDLQEEWTSLDQELVDHRARAILEEGRRNAPPQEPAHFHLLRQEFTDVFSNQGALDLARSMFLQEQNRAARERKPFDEVAAHRKALTQAGIEYGLRRPSVPPVDPRQAARFGGTPPVGGNGNGAGVRHNLSAEEKSMARAYAEVKGIPAEKAEEAWTRAIIASNPNYFG